MGTKKEAKEAAAGETGDPFPAQFEVRRMDPFGMIQHKDCDYLVFDLTHATPAVTAATKAYADALAEAGDDAGAKAVRDRNRAKWRPGMLATALEVVSGEKVPVVLVKRSSKHGQNWIARPEGAAALDFPHEFLVRESDLEARED